MSADRNGNQPPSNGERDRAGEQKSVNLSIEERAIVVMPEMPDASTEVKIGGAPPPEGPADQGGKSESGSKGEGRN